MAIRRVGSGYKLTGVDANAFLREANEPRPVAVTGLGDFYDRNPQARDLGNRASPSRLLDGRSREMILRNTFIEMRSIRRWRGASLWTWVGAITGHGSGYSLQICVEMGWDPEMRITPTAELPRRSENGS